MRDDRVVKVTIELLEQHFDDPVQNRAGAAFDNQVAEWRLQDGIIHAEQRSSKVTHSIVRLYATGQRERENAEFVEKAKSGAKKL